MMWAFMIISSLAFVLFPEIDLYVMGLFYTEAEGFYLNDTLFEKFFYYSVAPMLFTLFIGGLGLWLYNRLAKKSVLNFTGRQFLYIILVGSIGSGLIVNEILKKNWGRQRPAYVTQFGGVKKFTPAFVISDQDGNSFSCGHGSGAFVLIAVALLFRRHKKLVMGAVLAYGFAVSFARIIAGGHFFSDVMVSFFIMWIVAKVLYYLMFREKAIE